MLTAGKLRALTVAVDGSPVSPTSEVVVTTPGGATLNVTRAFVRRTYRPTGEKDADGNDKQTVDREWVELEVG